MFIEIIGSHISLDSWNHWISYKSWLMKTCFWILDSWVMTEMKLVSWMKNIFTINYGLYKLRTKQKLKATITRKELQIYYRIVYHKTPNKKSFRCGLKCPKFHYGIYEQPLLLTRKPWSTGPNNPLPLLVWHHLWTEYHIFDRCQYEALKKGQP